MSPKRYRRLCSAVILAFALGEPFVAGYASAQTPSPEMQTQIRAVAAACRADIRKFCSGVEPGGGRIAACLGAKERELASGCRSALDSVRRK